MRGDRKKMIMAGLLALLLGICGFLLFLKPQLGAKGAAPGTPDQQTAHLAQTVAFPSWTPQQMAADLQTKAQAAQLTLRLSVGDVQASGSTLVANLSLNGTPQAVMGFLDAVGQSVRVEGGQLRGSGPLYVLSNLTLKGDSKNLTGTVTATLTISGSASSTIPPAGTTTTATTPAGATTTPTTTR